MPASGQEDAMDTAKVPSRFTVKERQWPQEYGGADICLWKHDAIGALSITIDDNTKPDHHWWLEMGDTYGLRVSWMVITSHIGDPFSGPWDDYRKLVARGHDVQSHSVTAMHPDRPAWKGVEAEFTGSKKAIEENIPGVRCLTYAYPGGGKERTQTSKEEMTALAAKYYIGARGGPGINAADTIDYHRISSISGKINFGDAKFATMDMKHILEKSGNPRTAPLYRGWYVCHFHLVKPDDKAQLQKPFAIVAEKTGSGDLWMGLFREVCLYVRERDTAKLAVEETKPGRITFVVTDSVADDPFDFPLTVKVRLDASWKSAKATQNAKEVPVKLIGHQGTPFALVDAVPDRGPVILENPNP